MDIISAYQELEGKILELPRRSEDQRHFLLSDDVSLSKILNWAREENYFFRTMVATDERLRESRSFKLYYLFSNDKDQQIIIFEIGVAASEGSVYPSGRSLFPAVASLEELTHDMFGLKADIGMEEGDGFLLHNPAYPTNEPLLPLRRTRTKKRLDQILLSGLQDRQPNTPAWINSLQKEGMYILSVGPVHAQIIESGQFLFFVAGEIVESLSLRLGYKHRGVEKLFETHHTLETGWKLAERISGDSAFAHSLAYCQAVENIVSVSLPECVQYLRALFLELERIYNHVADVGALAHDLSFDKPAAKISSLRETMVQLNQRLSGSRLLRGINFPGGLNLAVSEVEIRSLGLIIEAVTEEFLEWAKSVMENPKCRERLLGTGQLPYHEALNATGLVAKASGLLGCDWRLQHPQGAYKDSEVQTILHRTIAREGEENTDRQIPIYHHDLKGDVFARLAMRVAEVETSAKLILYFAKRLQDLGRIRSTNVPIKDKLLQLPGLNFGIGIVEGWRGDVAYVVFKGREDTIFRCSPRDPSVINWRVFPKAVQGNRLSDFPLINKSFNLSYAGFDL